MRYTFLYAVDKYDQSHSVRKKIHEQVEEIRKHGVEAIIVNNEIRDFFYNPNLNKKKQLFNIIGYYLFQEKRWYDLLYQNILKLNGNDILYLRMPFPSLFCFIFFRKRRLCKIIIEHQSIEYLEYLGKKNFFYPVFDYLLGGRIRSLADGLIGVTPQILNYQKHRVKRRNIPGISIGNGINTSLIPIRTPPLFDGTEIHVLIASNINRSYGIDRFIQGMAQYPENIILHIAGTGPELLPLKTLVSTLNLKNKVFFYGWITGHEYDLLFDKCHIGISALGAYRWGFTESSSLKERDYCCRGMPFIADVEDPDFDKTFIYRYLVNCNEDIIKIPDIKLFAKKIFSDPDHPKKMREYAIENLDWSIKIETLIQFIEHIINKEEIN